MSSDDESGSDDFRSGSRKRRRGNKWEDDSDDDTGKLGRRRRTDQNDAIYGVFADDDGSEDEGEPRRKNRRAASGAGAVAQKLHQPMAFVSAGAKASKRWDAAEEPDDGVQAGGDESDEDADVEEEEEEEEAGLGQAQSRAGRARSGLARDEDVLERLGLGSSTGLGASTAADDVEDDPLTAMRHAQNRVGSGSDGRQSEFAHLLSSSAQLRGDHGAAHLQSKVPASVSAAPADDVHALNIDGMDDTPSLVPPARPGLGHTTAATAGSDSAATAQQGGLSNSSFRELLLRAKQASDVPSGGTAGGTGEGVGIGSTGGIGSSTNGLSSQQMNEDVGQRAGESVPDRKPPPTLGPGFAKFEQHTKGFGAKYLSKFGFGGRLGKNEQGITAPVEVKVRPNALGLGFGGFKEATKLKHNKRVEEDYTGKGTQGTEENDEEEEGREGGAARAGAGYGRAAGPAAPAAIRKPKPAKMVYRSAADLLAAQDGVSASTGTGAGASGAGTGVGTIIDMTGRRARIVASMGDALTPAEEAEAESGLNITVGKELVHNLTLLRDQAVVELTSVNRNAKAAKARVDTLHREVQHAREAESAAAAKSAACEALRSGVLLWQQRLSTLAAECNSSSSTATATSSSKGGSTASHKLSYLQQAYGSSSSRSEGGASAVTGIRMRVADDEEQLGAPVHSGSLATSKAQRQDGPFFRLCHALADAASAYESLHASYPDSWNDLSFLCRAGPAMVAEALPALTARWGLSLVRGVEALEADGKLDALCATLRAWHQVLSRHASRASAASSSHRGHVTEDGLEDGDAMDEDDEDGGIPLPPGSRPAGGARRSKRVAFGVPGLSRRGGAGGGDESAAGAARALIELVQTQVLAHVAQTMVQDASWVRSPSALLHVLSCLAPSSTVSAHVPWGTAWGSAPTAPGQVGDAQHADLISEAAYRAFLDAHVLPPLFAAVSAWDPFTDPVPVQDWTLPWSHPARLGPDTCSARLWPAIRGKMSSALAEWHPCDSSAVAMLRPWKGVWDGTAMQALCDAAIVPKLIAVLRQLQGVMSAHPSSPAPSELAAAPAAHGVQQAGPVTSGLCLGWVLQGWCMADEAGDDERVEGLGGILPARYVSALLEGELWSPWMRAWAVHIGLPTLLAHSSSPLQALSQELVQSIAADVAKVQWAHAHAWYASWRACIPSVLLTLPSARMAVYHAVQLGGVCTKVYGLLAAGEHLTGEHKEQLMACSRVLSRYSSGDAEGAFRTSASGSVLPRSQGVTFHSILARDARTEATIAGLGYGSSTGTGGTSSMAPPPTRPGTGPAAVSLPSALARAALAGTAPPGVTSAHVTFKDFVQAQVEAAGLAFLPNTRRAPVDGCVVYRAGEVNCYMQQGVVFAEQQVTGSQGVKYEAIAVEELVKRARAAAQRR